MHALFAEIKNITDTPRDLRNFGFVVGAICMAIAVWFFVSGRHAWQLVAGVGVVLLTAGLLAPRVLKLVYRPWMMLGAILGFFMTRVILAAVFFLVMTPLGAVKRLFGSRSSETQFRAQNGAESYWHHRTAGPPPKEQLEKQF